MGPKTTLINQRKFKLCTDGKIEDEFHVLYFCHFPNIAQSNDYDNFIWLMSQEIGSCQLKVAAYLQ